MPRIANHHVVMLLSALVASAISAPIVSAASANGLVCRSCVETSDIKDSSITSSDIKNSTVTTSDIKNSTISASDVKDNSLGANDVGAGAVGTSELADGGVGSDDIGDGAVGSVDIADGGVGSGDLVDGGVGSSDIADGGVAAADIAVGAVGASALGSAVVSAAAIATDAVGAAAIAASAVGSSEVADGSIATSDVAFDPVTETELETEIDGFNASRSAWHDITPLSIENTTIDPMFGLALHNQDGNDDQIVVTRDTRLMLSGSITLGGSGTAENVRCMPYLDSAPYPPAIIGAASYASVAPGEYASLPISGSATVEAGTYDVYVGCGLLSAAGDGVITVDGYLNVWLAEQ